MVSGSRKFLLKLYCAGRVRVDDMGEIFLVLGAIDRGVGCSIDDKVGTDTVERGGNLAGPG